MEVSDGPPPEIVCDAGPLIHLDELGCIGLLADFPRILVTDAVWHEVSQHRPTALTQTIVGLARTSAPQPMSAELETLSRLLGLHRGEKEALHLRAATEAACS